MVGHKDIFMQFDVRKSSGQRDPHRLGHLAWALQRHLVTHDRAKDQAMVLGTHGDKIETGLTVVIAC